MKGVEYMSSEEKLLELVKMAEEGIALPVYISLANLKRLTDGDLSHIGDGLLEGRSVSHYGEFILREHDYYDLACNYSLAPLKCTDSGEEVEELYEVYLCEGLEQYFVKKVYKRKSERLPLTNTFFVDESKAQVAAEEMTKFLKMSLEEEEVEDMNYEAEEYWEAAQ